MGLALESDGLDLTPNYPLTGLKKILGIVMHLLIEFCPSHITSYSLINQSFSVHGHITSLSPDSFLT